MCISLSVWTHSCILSLNTTDMYIVYINCVNEFILSFLPLFSVSVAIGQLSRVFANSPGDRASIPG